MTTRDLKLGVIGMSDGNGHPYSWSAIFNGYDADAMADCGFPAIPAYLATRSWPDDRLPGARVTHVWTQDPALSGKVSRAAHVPHVVKHPADMLGAVDAVLLARDDAQGHLSLAAPFLDAGVPVYIDKPVALSQAGLDALYAHQQYEGQIFSCSAMRYAADLHLDDAERARIGPLRLIQATTPKSWAKYAVHIIEPVLRLPVCRGAITIAAATATGQAGGVTVCRIADGPDVVFTATGMEAAAPISIRYCGAHGMVEKVFADSFTAFRSALADFVAGVRDDTVQSTRADLARIVQVIEAGMV